MRVTLYSILVTWHGGFERVKDDPGNAVANITPMISYLCTPTPTSDRAIDRTTESITMLLHNFDAKSERAIFRSMPAPISSRYELKGGRTSRILRQMSHNIGVPPPAAEMAS